MERYIISLIALYMSAVGMIGLFLLYAELMKRELKKSKKEAATAYVDALTGLGNRYKFNKVLADMIKFPEQKFYLCFLDLDDFKHINDNMGHDAGDELLIELGRRLKESLDDHGEVFRLGGDEYALMIVGANTKLEVETIVKRVQRSVEKPINIRDNIVNLEYSLGIASFPEDSQDAYELVNIADSAMYYVKESGKSSYYFHNEALKAKTDNKRRMENDLKAAYANQEFGIDYQPRIDIKVPNKIWLETFLYWNHPKIGKLRAEYFMSYAETTGLIISLDQFVIEDSIRKLEKFKENGFDNICIAVNVSIRHFQRKDFIEKLCDILEKNKVRSGTIMFQITDKIDITKIEEYKVMFEKLKKLGIIISINDLYIRYEELDLLNRLQIDEIKINSEYIVSNSIFKKSVLKHIIYLCKDLGYEILITKISDENTLQEILKYPINRVQGNHIYPIIENSKIEEFVVNYTKKQTKLK